MLGINLSATFPSTNSAAAQIEPQNQLYILLATFQMI